MEPIQFPPHELHSNSYTTNTFLFASREGFVSITFKSQSGIFLLVKAGCNTRSIFFRKSCSSLRTGPEREDSTVVFLRAERYCSST